ncbi:hypothetical protein LCGC14_2947470, partial [marine sediment metagenome]
MAKVAIIGAGSMVFSTTLTNDILQTPGLEDSTVALMDPALDRVKSVEDYVSKVIKKNNLSHKVFATADRKEALEDADYVITTFQIGGMEAYRYDYEIPMKYGVNTNIGDTRGPSGIFRGMRTIPVMLDIVRDMERLCPDATMLNYTNPMVLLCRAMQRETSIKLTGLCHSVQGTAEMLAQWIGAPMEEITYTCAGINHMAWYLDYKWNGEDAYPLIRQAITERPEIYNEEIVRNEMFLALDHYVTESSGHNSEYNWWFRKRPDEAIQYAENPPKKYQDIYPFDFETSDWKALWRELTDIFLHWAAQGIRIFRVDNPHTKTFGFWEYCIGEVKARYPDA